jgi:transcriptional regulator with GAF, ATPase, and Fis domain
MMNPRHVVMNNLENQQQVDPQPHIEQPQQKTLQEGTGMGSSMMWRTNETPAVDLSVNAGIRSEIAMDNRLNTLREVALTLLREVESFRVTQPATKRSVRLHDEVRRFEIDLIRSALSRTAGNQTRAAQLLGVKITTLNTKIKRYKIAPVGYEAAEEALQEPNAH